MQGDFESRQRERRRKANADTLVAVLWEAAMAAVLLWLRGRCGPASTMGIILLCLAALDAALIIPILIVRHQRMKEIAGGEEDEAGNY